MFVLAHACARLIQRVVIVWVLARSSSVPCFPTVGKRAAQSLADGLPPVMPLSPVTVSRRLFTGAATCAPPHPAHPLYIVSTSELSLRLLRRGVRDPDCRSTVPRAGAASGSDRVVARAHPWALFEDVIAPKARQRAPARLLLVAPRARSGITSTAGFVIGPRCCRFASELSVFSTWTKQFRSSTRG